MKISSKLKIIFLCVSMVFIYGYAKESAIHSGSVLVAGHTIHYNWQGTGKVVVLLHGVFASKEQWHLIMPLLVKHGYEVIAPDLPGFGSSADYPLTSYDLQTQAILLHEFMNKLKIQRINLAGNSMGGAIAAIYAKKYPKSLISLAFLGAPLGVVSLEKSPADKLLAKGMNPFIPTNQSEFNRELALIFTHPPKIPQRNIDKHLHRYVKEYKKDKFIWQTITKYKNIFNKPYSLHNIPVLILWGEDDKIFDKSGAKILKKNIAHSHLIEIPNGSHLIMLENSKETANSYVIFLNNVNRSSMS